MLNSTKTWQEEFKTKWSKFSSDIHRTLFCYDKGNNVDICALCGVNADELGKNIEQFISDLRKKDMEALIGMLPKMDIPKHRDYHHPDNISYTLGDVKAEKIYTRNNIEKLIKEYYEN